MYTASGRYLNRIPYVRVGTGARPILVLNGGQAFVRRPSPARAAHDATRVARLLPARTSFVLLGYDLSPPADASVGHVLADLAQVIAAEFGPARVVGISYGGVVGLHLAAAHPRIVTDLVLLASAHDFSAEGRRRVLRQIAFAEARRFDALMGDFAAVFRRPWWNALLRARLRLGRRSLAARLNDPEVIVRGLRAVLDAAPPDPAWLGRVRARTLVVGGSRDQFFGDGRMEETAARIENATLRILDGETHMAPVERARDVAAVVSGFLTA